MRWLLGIPAGFVIFFLALFAVAAVVGHTVTRTRWIVPDPAGRYDFVVKEYAWMPFGINGKGRFPGVVSVVDDGGHVKDEERVDNVYSVRGIQWDESVARFDYEEDGKMYVGTLDFNQ